MARRKKLSKPIKKMNSEMRTKSLVLFSCIILSFSGIAGHTIYTRQTKGEEYTKKILFLQSASSSNIPFQRGDIRDRNGAVLATSIAVYDLILDVSVMDDESIIPTAHALAQCFEGLDETELINYMNSNRSSMYHVLKKGLTMDDLKPFEALKEKKEYDKEGKEVPNNIKGVDARINYIRTYPYKDLASSVVGFASAGNVGTIGLESYYNNTLNGVEGRYYGFLNADSLFERTVISPEDGDNLILTIDANMQMIVENKLREFYEKYANN